MDEHIPPSHYGAHMNRNNGFAPMDGGDDDEI